MPYESVERALRLRLASATQALNRGPSYPYQQRERPGLATTDPLPHSGAVAGLAGSPGGEPLTLTTRVGGLATRFYVLPYDRRGENASLWPLVTYRLIREEFRASNYHAVSPLAAPFGEATTYNAVTGEPLSGATGYDVRDHPDPLDMTYEIKVWSDDDATGKSVLSFVKQVFPARGALQLQARDGSLYSVDLLRVAGPRWSGGLEPSLEEGSPGSRFYAWELEYVVEGYEDNSLETDTKPTVVERYLDLGASDSEPAEELVPLETTTGDL